MKVDGSVYLVFYRVFVAWFDKFVGDKFGAGVEL